MPLRYNLMGYVLLALSLLVILSNYYIIILSIVTRKFHSVVPLIGGLLGTLALFTITE